jgi:hypothetical protein
LANAKQVVHLEVAMFALLGLAAAGGAVAIGTSVIGGEAGAATVGGAVIGGSSAGKEDEVEDNGNTKGRKSSSLASAKVKHHQTKLSHAKGDRSRSWLWPGTAQVDRVSRGFPVAVAPVTPLLARLGTDGQYLRAMFGSGSIVLITAGGILSMIAVANVHGHAAPPAAWLLGAMIAIGILDAVAGFLEGLIFAFGVLVGGGLGSADAIRTMLGLAIILFAVPLLAGAARPLRRPPPTSVSQWWDRGGDLVIASLIGCWAVYKMVQALPGLSGHSQPIVASAGILAALALSTVALRFALETASVHWFPARLAEVECDPIGHPGRSQQLASLALRTSLFVFIAYAFLGNCWELWVGVALFVLPQVLKMTEDHFPNSTLLFRFIPTKVLKTVVLLVVGALWVGFVFGRIHDPRKLVGYSFILLSIPGLLYSIVELFGRDGSELPRNWAARIVGVSIVVAGVLLATGIVTVQ